MAQSADRPLAGVVVPRVVCAGNPEQSYALYLPTQFSTRRRWPIIYVFDPGARGEVAVETIRAAAEKYGYIVVGSNNSHNGAQGAPSEAAKAMWDDTQQRFPVDERRRYFAGTSGGARVATALALSCNCVAGVIGNAAGFAVGQQEPPRPLKFAYYLALGNADFNFPESLELRRKLEQGGAKYRIRIFEGRHGWAPNEVWLDALDWMDLQAMKEGALQRDAARIQQSYEQKTQKASQLLAAGSALEALREYRFAVRDFAGLIDVTATGKKVEELSKDKRIKAEEREESSAVDAQQRLMSGPSAQMAALSTGELDAAGFMELRNDLEALRRDETGSQRNQDRRWLVLERAISGLVIQAFESGQASMEQKRYDRALHFFDLIVAGGVSSGWGHYERARVYAAMKDKKHMLAELNAAYAGGFHDPGALAAGGFQLFKEDPDFQKVLRDWSGHRAP